MSRFKPAARRQLKLRMAFVGPTGSGKTYSALRIAAFLGKRIALIDTEGESARKYVGRPGIPPFDVLELDQHSPRSYVDAIHEAERDGYDVVIVDSLSHAWMGRGGALEMVDNAAKRSKSGNSFTAWRDVTPEHNDLVDALVRVKAHMMVTMRAKTEYFMEDGPGGKKTPRKVGMAPVQREGLEYEFDVVGDMDFEHNLIVSKTRCDVLDGKIYKLPGEELARVLRSWLDEGEAAPARAPRGTESERPFAGAGHSMAEDSRQAFTEQPERSRPTSSESRSSTTETTGQTTARSLDDYGITMPASKCPVVQAQGENRGKLWSELPGWMIEKWLADPAKAAKMNDAQVEWATYLMARRVERKRREADAAAQAEAERAIIEGDEPPNVQAEETAA